MVSFKSIDEAQGFIRGLLEGDRIIIKSIIQKVILG